MPLFFLDSSLDTGLYNNGYKQEDIGEVSARTTTIINSCKN